MNDSRHTGWAASFKRVRLIAQHSLGEALHLRLTLLLALVGAALIFGALWLRHFNFGSAELKFIGDIGLGAIGLLGTLLAALLTAQLFFKELESRAAYWALTRPVRRWEYIAGKFVGVVGVLALFVAALGGLLGVLLMWRSSELGTAPFAVAIFLGACAVQWLKITLVAAMTLLVCSYAGSALFSSCAGLLLTVVAHLRVFASDSWGWLRVWPDLSLFNAENVLASGAMPGTAWLLGLAGYWAVYVVCFGAVAAYAFQRREL
ncbi:ABC transporter permease subunit [Oleiharenicola lentus]|uniref:ABC transporter permease subunit n=1 Tax=Oleiharenicola lentus TaxID=2508720 RepID=UPI003F66657C